MEFLPLANRAVDAADPASATPITRRRQAGGDHRRRRHRRRLPRHRAPPGRAVGPPVRDHAPAARRPRSVDAVADLAADVPDLVGPRGGRRAGLRGQHHGVRRRRRPARSGACGPARWRCPSVDGRPRFDPVEGTEFELPCELVLLALGFSGPGAGAGRRRSGCRSARAAPSPVRRPTRPTCPGVFVCGDAGRGQSLIVWAIAEGRSAAAAVDRHLCGDTLLPAPLPDA